MPEQTNQFLNQENLNKNNSIIYFKNLDVLRTLAAFMVVIAHGYEGWTGWMGYPTAIRADIKDIHTPSLIGKFINQIIQNFSFGVDIFFLISGFLITYILLNEKKKLGKISIKKFMIRRSLRIWPLYYLIVILAPVLIYVVNITKPHWMPATLNPNYLKYYFFLGNFDVITTHKWMFPLAHFWSICVEEHFYLVWPFIIAFVPNRHLIKVFITFILASIVSRGYYFVADPSNSYFQIYLNTICRIDIIIIGAIVAYIHDVKPIILNTSKFVRFILLIGFIGILGTIPIYHSNELFQILFKKYLFIIWVGFLMLNFMFNEKPLIAFDRKGALHYLGKISFGIYIYHNILIGFVIDNTIARFGGDKISFSLFFIIYISATIFVSIISWEFFEKQILKFKERFEIIRTTR